MPHTVASDELAKKPRAAKVQEVKDQLSLKDDSEEIRLYNIANPHAEGMILAHVVKPNVVFVTDILSPRGPIERNPRYARRRRSAQEERHHQLHDRGRSRHDRQAGRDRLGTRDGSEQPLEFAATNCAASGREPDAALFRGSCSRATSGRLRCQPSRMHLPFLSRCAICRSFRAGRRQARHPQTSVESDGQCPPPKRPRPASPAVLLALLVLACALSTSLPAGAQTPAEGEPTPARLLAGAKSWGVSAAQARSRHACCRAL